MDTVVWLIRFHNFTTVHSDVIPICRFSTESNSRVFENNINSRWLHLLYKVLGSNKCNKKKTGGSLRLLRRTMLFLDQHEYANEMPFFFVSCLRCQIGRPAKAAGEQCGGVGKRATMGRHRIALPRPKRRPVSTEMGQGRQPWARQGSMDERGNVIYFIYITPTV